MKIKRTIKKIIKTMIKEYLPNWLIKIVQQIIASIFFCVSKLRGIKAYLIGEPEYCNLGDHAIGISENQLLDSYGLKYLEITQSLARGLFMYKNQFLSSDILLFLYGGGNMGVQYSDAEKARRCVLCNYPENKIIIFPQTIDYGNSEFGKLEQENSKDIYNNCSSLCIVAREKTSYKIMKELYPSCNVIFTPDIVLSMRMKLDKFSRNGALLCLRSDVEKSISNEDKLKIEKKVNSLFSKITYTDTVTKYSIDKKVRKDEVLKKLKEFAQSKLVVTDRLHGMIFAALTGTPCIVIGNYNHKVRGEYEWLKDNPYIAFLEDISDFDEVIEQFAGNVCCKEWTYQYHDERYQPLYDVMEEYLKEVK